MKVGKVAIVTGTTGIGRAIALRFAAGGASVLACGIDVAANNELARDAAANGLSIRVQECDVTQAEPCRPRSPRLQMNLAVLTSS